MRRLVSGYMGVWVGMCVGVVCKVVGERAPKCITDWLSHTTFKMCVGLLSSHNFVHK